MGNHRFVQPPMLLSVRMDVCLENCLNTYTCFQPFGLMPGLVSEHPAEGVYFRKHSINSPFHSKNVILLL